MIRHILRLKTFSRTTNETSLVRPGGGVAGDDSDVGLLRVGGRGGAGSQAGGALRLTRMPARYQALAVLHVLALLVVINYSDVFGHVLKLVGQSLTLHFGEDAALVVIPTHTHTESQLCYYYRLPLQKVQEQKKKKDLYNIYIHILYQNLNYSKLHKTYQNIFFGQNVSLIIMTLNFIFLSPLTKEFAL